jgi:CGNR zinc finger
MQKRQLKYLADTIYHTPYWRTIQSTANSLDVRNRRDRQRVRSVLDPYLEHGPCPAVEEAFEAAFGDMRNIPDRRLELRYHHASKDMVVIGWESANRLDEALLKLFQSPASLRRVKKCPECDRYFFDTTKRNNAIYDVKTCTNRALERKYQRRGAGRKT